MTQAAPKIPSEADVMFGRACMNFKLVTRDQLMACLADQRRLAAEVRFYTLAQVMVGRKLITQHVYNQVVAKIRESLAAQNKPVAQVPPDITASGRYDVGGLVQAAKAAGMQGNLPAGISATPVPAAKAKPVQWGQLPTPEKEEIHEAARSWDDASSVLENDSYEVVVEANNETTQSAQIVTPKAAREKKDAGIRRLLGIGEDVQEFDFGEYHVLGEIAAGGMGVIYRALAKHTKKTYALKALINVDQANDKQLRRFVQEAQSAMKLDHPGIVKIHDIGVYKDIPYFTMDLIEGNDLQHHVRARSYTIKQMLKIVEGVCHAVHYAHEHAVIHRDLKPANIIVRERDRQPILTDFGLAKMLDSSFKLTAEGAMVGTPLFLSPEQVSGRGHEVDRRCDVYGLGVMMYQILTDRLPFVGRNPYEVYRKVLEEDPTPPTQVNPAISPELEKICLMALAKDKEERYDTAALMGADVARYLQGDSVEAALPTPVAVAKARRAGSKKSSSDDGAPGGKASPMLLAGIVGLLLLIALGIAAIVALS